jgi:hypothetical protein
MRLLGDFSFQYSIAKKAEWKRRSWGSGVVKWEWL